MKIMPFGFLTKIANILKFTENVTDGAKFNGSVNDIAVQADGKTIIAGGFTNYASTYSYLIRLNTDYTIDTTFCNNASVVGKFNSTVYSISIRPDGLIVLGGNFKNYNGITGLSYLIYLNTDGTLNSVFSDNASRNLTTAKFNSTIFSVATLSDNTTLIGGGFTNYNGTSGRNALIKVNAVGGVDAAFCTSIVDGKFTDVIGNPAILKILIQANGKMLIGGSFINYGGTSGRHRLLRLNSDNSLDTAFLANCVDGAKFTNNAGTFNVAAIAEQADGALVIGGTFANYGGTVGRNRIVRVSSSGVLDTTFCANAVDGTKFNQTVNSIAATTSGKIMVSGSFTNYGGVTGRNILVLLNSDGTLDTSYTSIVTDGTKFSNTVSVVKENATNYFIGGLFINYAGTTGRNRLIATKPDGSIY